jgi:hypothetical protein
VPLQSKGDKELEGETSLVVSMVRYSMLFSRLSIRDPISSSENQSRKDKYEEKPHIERYNNAFVKLFFFKKCYASKTTK